MKPENFRRAYPYGTRIRPGGVEARIEVMNQDHVTEVLQRAVEGHPSASEELLPLVYDELRRLAQSYMSGERSDHTLQATALANEVCARLLGARQLSWQSRAHFFAVASRAMRRVLSGHARDRRALKRKPHGARVTLEHLAAKPESLDLIALDDTLNKLSELNQEHANLVELKIFGGLSLDEISLVVGKPKRTIERQWRAVQAWLAAELHPDGRVPGADS
jgi:RNA polymerase sigma-70 factor (ECF subfamily)